MTFERWRVWVLGAIGTASLLYVLAKQTEYDLGPAPASGLVWPFLAVLPTFGVGLWLAHVTASRLALYVLGSGTAMSVSVAWETYVAFTPSIVGSNAFPVINGVGLTADALATICGALALATYPLGTVERPWHRVALRFVWLDLLVAPLTLLVSPVVVVSPWLAVAGPPNPYAMSGLEWATPLVQGLLVMPWATVGLALLVFADRVLRGDSRTRARLRVMAIVLFAVMVVYAVFYSAELLGVQEGEPLSVVIAALVYAAMLALPVVYVHGVLHYGAFDVGPDERAKVVMRSASFLVAIIYAAAVATPAALLAWRRSTTVAVVLTVIMALALQPLRTWLLDRIRRRVSGDRAKQLALLTSLGTQLEHTASLRDVLDQLATTIRDGLSASWVRLRLLDTEGTWSESPRGEAGSADPATEPVTGHDLIRAGELIGRIDLGPRRVGDYTPHELDLLATVARQATTAVANVRLTTQLEEQLAELTASRERLVAVQDEERQRIERDLHDGIQQDVVALIAALRLARNRLGRGDLRPDELAELQDQAREMLVDLREIAHGIHPPVLTDNGLYAAVESRASRFPLPLEVTADDGVRTERFAADLETTAYYVVRESLANVAKHSDATAARVRLSRVEDRLVIDIEDDGHGFDLASTNGHGGLANIRDRIAAVRGRLVVTSTTGSGTHVTADLPVGARDGSWPLEASHD